MPHAERIAAIVARLDEATMRFVERLERAGERAERAGAGWSMCVVEAATLSGGASRGNAAIRRTR